MIIMNNNELEIERISDMLRRNDLRGIERYNLMEYLKSLLGLK